MLLRLCKRNKAVYKTESVASGWVCSFLMLFRLNLHIWVSMRIYKRNSENSEILENSLVEFNVTAWVSIWILPTYLVTSFSDQTWYISFLQVKFASICLLGALALLAFADLTQAEQRPCECGEMYCNHLCKDKKEFMGKDAKDKL